MTSTPPAAGWLRRLVPAALFQLAFVAALALLKSATNALVLARYPAGVLPWLYIGAAAVTAALTGFSASLRILRSSALIPLAAGGAVVTLGLAVLVRAGVPAASLVFYVFTETFATYLAISFWKSLSDAFDAREARRAFTAVNGVGMAGGVVGGLLAHQLAHVYGALSQVFVGAAALAVGALAFRWHRAQAAARAAPPPARGQRVWAFVRSHPFGRTLAAVVVLFAVLSALVDYLVRARAAENLGEDELAALFGGLQLWIGVASVVVQALAANWFLPKLGVLKYLAAVPIALGLLGGLSLVDPGLWPAYGLKLVEAAASFSILPVAMQLLYAPLPDDLRDGVRSATDGLVRKGGLALGGLLLLAAGSLASGKLLAGAVLALCALVGLALVRLRGADVAALQERVSGSDAALALEDGGDAMLKAALRAPEPERVFHALDMLEQVGRDVRPLVPTLFEHPHERVQDRAVELVLRHRLEVLVPRLEALLGARERRPRDAAAWALAQLAPRRAAQLLPPLLAADDIGLRCVAIGALLTLPGGSSHAEAAGAALDALAARGERAPLSERREVARLLGRVKDVGMARLLERYLDDSDGSVRRVAIAAAGEGEYHPLAPRLLQFLTWREERRAAREALARMGDAVMPLLEGALNDRSRPPALRKEIPRVIRQVGTPNALNALLFSNIADDAFLHWRIGIALARLKEEHPEIPVDQQRVREAIGRRVAVYTALVQPYRDLRAALGDGSLVTRAVGDRLDQAFELSFWLLGLLYDERAMRRVHAHLLGGDRRRQAYALELLENLVPEQDRLLVRDQIDAHHRHLPPGAAGRMQETLELLCRSDDGVLRACARYLARQKNLWHSPAGEDEMSQATVQTMFALEGVEIFSQSDVDDIAAVAALAREQIFRKGERVYAEGDPGDELYVIVEGSVEARREGERVMRMGAKEAFGDTSLLDGAPRPVEIIALEDLKVLVIDRRDFLDLLSDRPQLLRGVFRVLSRQIQKLVSDIPARRASGEHRLLPDSRR